MGIARNSDGWITYPRGLQLQAEMVSRWQAAATAYAPGVFKPFVQSLYIEMAEHPDHPPSPIHLILRAGCNVILQFLERLSAVCQPCGFEFQVRRTRCRSGGGRSWPRNFAAT
jgi:hypothetical protein